MPRVVRIAATRSTGLLGLFSRRSERERADSGSLARFPVVSWFGAPEHRREEGLGTSVQPIGARESLVHTQAKQSMPPQRPLPRIAWIAAVACAALPPAAPAMEQTCRGCLDACCRSHQCRYESASGACTLWECEEKFCPTCIGRRSNPNKVLKELENWIPFTKQPPVVPKDHGVSGRPPLVLKQGQVFVDGVDIADRPAARRQGRRNKP